MSSYNDDGEDSETKKNKAIASAVILVIVGVFTAWDHLFPLESTDAPLGTATGVHREGSKYYRHDVNHICIQGASGYYRLADDEKEASLRELEKAQHQERLTGQSCRLAFRYSHIGDLSSCSAAPKAFSVRALCGARSGPSW